ncbi:GAF domain-containing protein [Nostoc sp. NIES-2111]
MSAQKHLRGAGVAAFGHINRIALEHFRTPISFVSVIDRDEQWFLSSIGLPMATTTRADAFCSHTILGEDVMVVEDARKDGRFADNPLVSSEPFIRFYAGAPLDFGSGIRIGAVCIADTVPRSLNTGQRIVLRNLAEIAVSEIKLRAQLQAA